MAFVESMDYFFNTDDFAETGIYTPSGGSPVNISLIFDDESQFQRVDVGVDIEATVPTALVKSSNVSGVAEGDTLTIRGVIYTVVGAPVRDSANLIYKLQLKGP